MTDPNPQVRAALDGKLGVHGDVEADRLRDAVVDVVEHLPPAVCTHELTEARQALRDHRAKSPAPEVVTERCEPPEEFSNKRYHWLTQEVRPLPFNTKPWRWSGGAWSNFNGAAVTPECLHMLGWRYHSPATPDTRIEPTDEPLALDALRQIVGIIGPSDLSVVEHVRQLFARRADNRVMPTDEAVAEWLRTVRPSNYPALVRAALTHFSTPTVTGVERDTERFGKGAPSPVDILTRVHQRYGIGGTKAIGDFMHAMGSDAMVTFGDQTFTPCDIIMQQCWEFDEAESLQPASQNDSINNRLEQEKPPEPATPRPSQSAIQHAVEIYHQGIRTHESTESFIQRIMDCDDRRVTAKVSDAAAIQAAVSSEIFMGGEAEIRSAFVTVGLARILAESPSLAKQSGAV